MKVHLDVGEERFLLIDLDDSAPEVRPGAVRPKAWVQYAKRAPIKQLEVIPPQTLMMPDILHEPFRGKVEFAQFLAVLSASPLQIELEPCGKHDLEESPPHYAKSRNLKVQEKSRIKLRLNGDEVIYAFTQTLRRVTRPTIFAVRTALLARPLCQP
jgi:hypothetical protein